MNAQNAPTITAQMQKNVAIISIDVIFIFKSTTIFHGFKIFVEFSAIKICWKRIFRLYLSVLKKLSFKILHSESWHLYFAS